MAVINGTAERDEITGTFGPDTINGLGGNDQLVGDRGADVLDGGDGNDVLYGTEAGHDYYTEVDALFGGPATMCCRGD